LSNNDHALDAKNRVKVLLLEIAAFIKESGLSKEDFDSVKSKYKALNFWYDDCYELLVKETL